MATNRAIKGALLAKLNVTPQRLSQLTKTRKTQLPMSTEHAVYTLAHENGIDVSKHLSKEETTEVRSLVAQLRSASPTQPESPTNGRQSRRSSKPKPAVVAIRGGGLDADALPGMTAARAKEMKTMAEKVYPRLYFFENSLRDLIERVLSDAFGADWWEKAVPSKIKDKAREHKEAEATDAWHGKRGSRELDYILLSQLWGVMNHNWSRFKPYFPNKAWIEDLITNEMNVSRRVIAHMNPLSDDDVHNVVGAFKKWEKQLRAIHKKLP